MLTLPHQISSGTRARRRCACRSGCGPSSCRSRRSARRSTRSSSSFEAQRRLVEEGGRCVAVDLGDGDALSIERESHERAPVWKGTLIPPPSPIAPYGKRGRRRQVCSIARPGTAAPAAPVMTHGAVRQNAAPPGRISCRRRAWTRCCAAPGAGAGTAKSAPLLLVSVQPLVLRCAAVVLRARRSAPRLGAAGRGAVADEVDDAGRQRAPAPGQRALCR